MKKLYENPQTDIVVLNVNSEFLDGGAIYQGTPEKPFDDAKEQRLDFNEEESLPVDKNIWEDDEE